VSLIARNRRISGRDEYYAEKKGAFECEHRALLYERRVHQIEGAFGAIAGVEFDAGSSFLDCIHGVLLCVSL